MTVGASTLELARENTRPQVGSRLIRPDGVSDALVSLGLCLIIIVPFLSAEPLLRHWFIVPVAACGVVTALDLVPWLRGKRDLFDPIGIMGAVGFHFFFLAPILHVNWDHFLRYVAPPPDWRPWLGAMAFINFFGLVLYRAITRRRAGAAVIRTQTLWRIEHGRFFAFGALLLSLTTVLQLWVYWTNGGITGYIQTAGSGAQAFAGMGWLFVICEAGPIIAMMLYAVAAGRLAILRQPIIIAATLIVFFVLQMLFGGLRGSRANTVWAVFWAAGIVHYCVRRFARSIAVVGVGCFLIFMYFYGFYKNANMDMTIAFSSSSERLELEEKTNRTARAMLLGDLARSDVHAFELYRLTAGRDDYEYGWGRSYFGDLATIVPESLWPSKPPPKTIEGTNLLYGANSFRKGTFESSNVYGVVGELMLNFGPLAAPFGFLLLAWFVRFTDRSLRRWAPADGRWLLAPTMVNFSFLILVGDADNLLFFLIKSLTIPLVLLFATTRQVRLVERQTSCSEGS